MSELDLLKYGVSILKCIKSKDGGTYMSVFKSAKAWVALMGSTSCCGWDICKIPLKISSNSLNLFLYPHRESLWNTSVRKDFRIQRTLPEWYFISRWKMQEGGRPHPERGCRRGQDKADMVTGKVEERGGIHQGCQTLHMKHKVIELPSHERKQTSFFYFYYLTRTGSLNLTAAQFIEFTPHSSVHKVSSH